MALELINTDSMDTQQTFGIDQPKSVSFRTIDGTTYLFVAGKGDEIGSASVFSMGSDGVLTSIQHVFDGGPLELEGAASAVTAEIEGTVYLFVAGTTDDGLSVFAVGEDGRLTNVDNVADDGTLRLNGVNSVATATFGDTTFLIVASRIDGGISSYSIAANGTLAEVQSIADDGTLFTDGSSAVHVAVIDSLTYAFVAGSTDSGVSVFRVASDGTMTNVDNVGDGGDLELSSAGAVTTALVGDTTYLFVAGYSDSGISVFAVASDGTLSNVDNVSDDGTVNLALASGLTTAVIDGVTYLFATGQNDDGFSVFEVAGNGTLTNVANIADAGALELRGPSGLATVEIDGVLYLAVAGRLDNGVSVFRTEHNIIDEAAAVVEVAENGTAVVTVDKLYDDDTLAYTITGGDDAALFSVDAATGAVTFIDAPDFEAPQDADGDNIYDIEVTADDGIITEAKALAIEVTDVGGLDVSGTKTGETLTGGGEEDTIAGRGGKDILQGLGGGDLLDGGKKRDTLFGGDGEDQFSFSTRLKNKWADRIKDFEVGDDTILLDSAIFDGIGDGALKGKFFTTGKKASDGNDHVLWQKNKGWLRYDADGKGGDDAVKFARLDKSLDLSADDFLVV